MIDLLNKLFVRFGFRLVSKEEPHKEERCFLDDIKSPDFVNKYPDFLDRYFSAKRNKSLYVGDINYLEDKNGKTYYQDLRSKTYYCDYDVKNPSKEVLGLMITETKFTPEELAEKLND
jgi:hypothetical protein